MQLINYIKRICCIGNVAVSASSAIVRIMKIYGNKGLSLETSSYNYIVKVIVSVLSPSNKY